MGWVVGYVSLQIILFIVLLLGSWLIWDKRFSQRHGKSIPPGFHKTEEVNIDPVTGETHRVYYNPQTGERFYRLEK